MFFNKKGLVLVYVIFLLTIWVILATVIYKNSFLYYNNIEYQNHSDLIHLNVQKKAYTSFELIKFYNLNWGWFVDNISCPTSVTMSWTTNLWIISTTLKYFTWSIYCNWFYSSKNLDIFFNSGYTDFESAEYNWSIVTLTDWVWDTVFTDPDSTQISFLTTWLWGIDEIDDNFNSDDYKVWSTGSILYPDWYIDDDVLVRKVIYWELLSWNEYKSIFWNNSETSLFINNNSNNNDIYHEKIWDVDLWYMLLDVNWNYDLKLVKFDKNKFDTNKELYNLESLIWLNLSWSWYIQENSWVLWLSTTKTWNEYSFDFQNNDYALFLRNSWETTLIYSLSWESLTWSWIYINPLDDSWDKLEYLWNDIHISDDWDFIYKQFIVSSEK